MIFYLDFFVEEPVDFLALDLALDEFAEGVSAALSSLFSSDGALCALSSKTAACSSPTWA